MGAPSATIFACAERIPLQLATPERTVKLRQQMRKEIGPARHTAIGAERERFGKQMLRSHEDGEARCAAANFEQLLQVRGHRRSYP